MYKSDSLYKPSTYQQPSMGITELTMISLLSHSQVGGYNPNYIARLKRMLEKVTPGMSESVKRAASVLEETVRQDSQKR